MTANTHKLTIAVYRGDYYRPIEPGMRLREKFTVWADNLASSPKSCAYIRLTDTKGKTSTYFYDKSSRRKLLRNLLVATVSMEAISIATSCFGVKIPFYISLPIFAAVPAISACTTGRIVRKTKPADIHIYMTRSITARQYYDLQKDMRRNHESRGIYSLVFNNCAHMAIRVARQHGMPLKRQIFASPARLAKQMERYRRTHAPAAPQPGA